MFKDGDKWEQQKRKKKRPKKVVGRFIGDASFAGVVNKLLCV